MVWCLAPIQPDPTASLQPTTYHLSNTDITTLLTPVPPKPLKPLTTPTFNPSPPLPLPSPSSLPLSLPIRLASPSHLSTSLFTTPTTPNTEHRTLSGILYDPTRSNANVNTNTKEIESTLLTNTSIK